jgi:hypothetical protein
VPEKLGNFAFFGHKTKFKQIIPLCSISWSDSILFRLSGGVFAEWRLGRQAGAEHCIPVFLNLEFGVVDWGERWQTRVTSETERGCGFES